jgi:glycosyltransferase involved in cell wall biosynthesis
MKILIAADTYYPQVNGASYFTQRLAQSLSLRGHTVAVIAPGTTSKFAVTQQKNVTFFEVPSLPVPFLWNFRFTLPFLTSYFAYKVISTFKPDVIHIQMHFTVSRATLGIAVRKKIPVIATNHFMPENITHYLHLPTFIEKFINNLAWKDCARVLSKTNEITSPTDIASNLLSKYLDKHIHSISNGIDTKYFYPREVKEDFIKKYKLPSKFVLFVGRLDKEKNIDVVIRAMSLIKNNDIHLVIAGNGNERTYLENLTNQLLQKQRVHFLGFVSDEDLPNLYASAKCFINMGTAELQSIVTMEAMATHLPIIGADAVALPNLIHTDNGILIKPGDVQGVAKALFEIFKDTTKMKQMGLASYKYIKEHDINHVLTQYEDLYKQVLN